VLAGVCHKAAFAAVRRVGATAADDPPDEAALQITTGDLVMALDEVRALGQRTRDEPVEP